MVKYRKNKNLKYGFTLAEMLVSMMVVAIFFVATTKIITRKPPLEINKPPHGFFECYTDTDGVQKVHIIKGQQETGPNPSACNFTPPVGLAFINVHLATGGFYLNTQEPIFDKSISLASPEDMKSYFAQAFATEEKRVVAEEEDYKPKSPFYPPSQFREYLIAAHPNSKIIPLFNQDEVEDADSAPHIEYTLPDYPVLFIAW